MKALKKKWLGVLSVCLVTGMTCAMPLHFSAKTKDKSLQANKQLPSKISGYIQKDEACGHEPVLVSLSGSTAGTDVLVETEADTSGYFTITAPAGNYLLVAKNSRCVFMQDYHLMASTEQLYSIALMSIKDEKVQSEQKLLGGRLPASLLEKTNGTE